MVQVEDGVSRGSVKVADLACLALVNRHSSEEDQELHEP